MTTFSKKKSLLIVATAVSVLMIPGCSLFNSGNQSSALSDQDISQEDMNDSSRSVVTMSGKPLITQNKLEREKQDLIEANPQVKAMIGMMPAAQFDRNLVEGLTNQEVIAHYIKNKGIDQSDAYKTEMNRIIRSVKQMLNTKFFSESIPANVTDKDVRDFYEANKDVMPQLLLSRGGVAAKGISFTKDSEAQAFFDKVNILKGDLEKAAQEMGLADKINDFKLVHNQSMGIDAQLRDKIINMSVCPSVELISLGDSMFWVVQATHREESKYREFEPIKNELRAYLEQQQRAKATEQEIARLKQEYNVVIDESYFGNAQPITQEEFDDMSMDEDMGSSAEDMEDMPEEEAFNEIKGTHRTSTAA